MKRTVTFIIVFLAALSLAAASCYILARSWPPRSTGAQKTFAAFRLYKLSPAGNKPAKSAAADLDGDGINEDYVLQNGALKVTAGSALVWQSLPEWWVDDFVLADSNNDGRIDLNLSVWKAGDFGPSHPFWIKENDQSVKNHFFIFDFRGGRLKPVWQSSNLEAPNCRFEIADADHDGKNELLALEGDYADWPACAGKYQALWRWNGWGFTNWWRGVKGDYDVLDIKAIISGIQSANK